MAKYLSREFNIEQDRRSSLILKFETFLLYRARMNPCIQQVFYYTGQIILRFCQVQSFATCAKIVTQSILLSNMQLSYIAKILDWHVTLIQTFHWTFICEGIMTLDNDLINRYVNTQNTGSHLKVFNCVLTRHWPLQQK